MDLVQPIADLAGVLGLYAALRRDQKRTRAMVFAIAKHLGLRLEDGIHVETRTPARGSSIVSQINPNGDTMRKIIPILIAAVAIALVAGGAAYADGGENTAAVGDAVKNGVAAAAPSAFSGNWVGAVFGFLAGAVPGLLAVLSKQSQDKWHIFHATQAIATARALPPPSSAPSESAKS